MHIFKIPAVRWGNKCVAWCRNFLAVALLIPFDVEVAQTPTPATVTSAAPSVMHLSHEQEFLTKLTQKISTLMAGCVKQNWNVIRPLPQEARRLRWKSWEPNLPGYNGTTLDSIRAWWVTLPVQYQMWAVCEGNLLPRLLKSLHSTIAAGELFPTIQPLLLALTDTTRSDGALYVASRIRADSAAAKIRTAAAAIGDSHRYDAAIAEGDGISYSYRGIRGEALALLGRMYLKGGQLVEAWNAGREARNLTPWIDPMLLADISLGQGDTVGAIRELAHQHVTVFESDVASRDSMTMRQLTALYRTVNQGTLVGLDTVLKNALRDASLQFPVPIMPWLIHRHTRDAPQRMALLQYYTWVHCGSCLRHDLSAEALTQRFSGHLITLAYHYVLPLTVPGWQDVGNDIGTTLRHMLHVGTANTTEDPSNPRGCDWWLNGACIQLPYMMTGGRIGALIAFDQTSPTIERQIIAPSVIDMALRARLQNDHVMTEITVKRIVSVSSHYDHPLKLQVVLVEDSLLIPGANSPIQNHVVRAIAGDSAIGFGVRLPGEVQTHVEHTVFDLGALEQTYRHKMEQHRVEQSRYIDGYDPVDWNDRVSHFEHTQLSVVAYIQDQVTGEVLQVTQQKLRMIAATR